MIFSSCPPTACPTPMDGWDEFEALRHRTRRGGHDHRPQRDSVGRAAVHLGTIENRVLDSVPTFAELGAMTALTQCLAEYMSRELDDGRAIARLPMWFMKENKWRPPATAPTPR